MLTLFQTLLRKCYVFRNTTNILVYDDRYYLFFWLFFDKMFLRIF